MLIVLSLACLSGHDYAMPSTSERRTRLLALLISIIFAASMTAAQEARTVDRVTPEDAQSLGVRERRRQDLLALLKKTPAEDSKRRYSLYINLAQLYPDNGEYWKKLLEYEKKAGGSASERLGLGVIHDATFADFEKLEVKSAKWIKGGFGTVAVWKVTFVNRSERPIGNILFGTGYISETGTRVDTAATGEKEILKVIMPGQTRTIEVNDGFVHSEAWKGGLKVVGWEFVLPPR